MTKPLLHIGLPLALAAFFLWRFVAGIEAAAVGKAIAGADWPLFSAAVLLGASTLALRGWRWQRLVRGVGRIPFALAYHATTIGFAASVVLPARAGEVIRPLLAARRERLPVAGMLASVAVERLLDLATILALFLPAVWWPLGLSGDPGVRTGMSRAGALLFAVLLALIAGLLMLSLFGSRLIDGTLGRLTFLPDGIRHRLLDFARHCLDGLVALKERRNLATVLVQTLAVWLAIDLQIWLTLRAFGFDLPFRASFVVVALSALGLLVPTPGGVGSFHKTVQFSLELYGIDPSSAAAFAVVHHLACFVPILLLGTISLVASGLSWGTVSHLSAEPDGAAAERGGAG